MASLMSENPTMSQSMPPNFPPLRQSGALPSKKVRTRYWVILSLLILAALASATAFWPWTTRCRWAARASGGSPSCAPRR